MQSFGLDTGVAMVEQRSLRTETRNDPLDQRNKLITYKMPGIWNLPFAPGLNSATFTTASRLMGP